MGDGDRQLSFGLEAARAEASGPRILTIGHSTRPIEAFVALLGAHAVTLVADVRAMPYSRRHPQFGREALARALAASGIGYAHLPALGGKREGRADSPNRAIGEAGFRAYADHMASGEFAAGLAALATLADAPDARVAMMCAEADPGHCHRGYIADALTLGGRAVAHIRDEGPAEPHRARATARLRAGIVEYPLLTF